jgi:hypothetical protein
MILQHFDAVATFIVIMVGVSLLITVGTQITISLLGLRGSNLRRSLADLFETAGQDEETKRYANEVARRLLRHPMISDSVFSRFCIRADKLPFIPPVTAGKLQWGGSVIPFRPWILGAAGGFFVGPVALEIMKRFLWTDVCRYSDVLASYVPWLNLCQHPWRTGAILGGVLAGLLSRWRLATWIRIEELLAALEKLSVPLAGTLPDPAQRAMLMMAWAENEPGVKAKQGSAQDDRLAEASPDFDEGIVRPEPKLDRGGSVAVAVERTTTKTAHFDAEGTFASERAREQIPDQKLARLEGLRAWFDCAMARASQRFTLQARFITVVLSLVVVFAAHLDAIRLMQTLSYDAQLRTQLAASAEAINRQADSMLRTREGPPLREGPRTVVPDVYRNAMASVLWTTPSVPEQPKLKTRPARHGVTPRAGARSELLPRARPATSLGERELPKIVQVALAGGQEALKTAQTTPEAPATREDTPASTVPKPKSPVRQRERSTPVPAPVEDEATTEAKARATHALETTPGFASREDAISWLRATLDGDPALENLIAAYEQEVNAELVSDSDKLIDQSASLKRELARSEFRLLPKVWPGWTPTKDEIPGLLVAAAFLSLGAPFWYNMLKKLASLRPQLAVKQEQERKQETSARTA